MTQRDLFDDTVAMARAVGELRAQLADELGASVIVRRFFEFHAKHPAVFTALLRFAREATNRRAHFGAKAIYERARWELAFATAETTGLKLNNNYTAYYARLLALYDPSLAHLFATRRLGPRRQAQVI